ncbi:MAG: MBOAT family protein, partial [Lachnospiraceae bacterium]|nr:MBOAT family protein [Lachnospiraceae bacterium]
WGLYYFVFIALERLFLGKLLSRIPKAVGWLYMMVVTVIGWVLFAVNGLDEFLVYITRMFGGYGGNDFMDQLSGVVILLVAGAVFSTPLVRKLYDRIKDGFWGLVLHLVLFWASVSALVDAAYNPFLYFRF